MPIVGVRLGGVANLQLMFVVHVCGLNKQD